MQLTLLIPHDLSKPGGTRESMTSGFTVLAEDTKGSLVRLDRAHPEISGLCEEAVFYAAHDNRTGSLLIIRAANQEDRMIRFRRPVYLDHLTMTCCNRPCNYMAIYDEESGRFFNLDVQPHEAASSAQGRIFYFFMCTQCSQSQTTPV